MVDTRTGRWRHTWRALGVALVAGLLVLPAACDEQHRTVATAESTLAPTEAGGLAAINASCRRFIEGLGAQEPATDVPSFRAFGRRRLELIAAASEDLRRAPFPASMESLRNDVAARLEEAAAIYRSGADVDDLETLQAANRRAEDALREVAIAFFDAGAGDCVPTPPDRGPVPSPPEAGELLPRAPVATISVGPPGADANRIVAGAGGVWVGLKNGRGVRRIDPATNEIVASIELGAAPGGRLVLLGDRLWVDTQGELVVIDTTTNAIERRFPRGDLGYDPAWIAIAASGAWSCPAGILHRVDLESGAASTSVPVDRGCVTVAADDHRVWVVDPAGALVRVDPDDGSTLASAPGRYDQPLLDGDVMWAQTPDGVTELDADDGTVLGTAARPDCSALQPAVGGGAFWITCPNEQRVIRIDRRTRALQELRAGNGVNAVAYYDGTLWAANSDAATVMRFDVRDLSAGE